MATARASKTQEEERDDVDEELALQEMLLAENYDLDSSDEEEHTEEETEYLFADSLTAISEDKNLKVKTWNALKLLFNISK